MTSQPGSLHFDIDTRRRRYQRHWLRAVRTMRGLVRHPDHTHLAFEIAEALDPDMSERSLLRMLEQPEGRRVYEERPSLPSLLADREALAAMPEGSFGRALVEKTRQGALVRSEVGRFGTRNLEHDLFVEPLDRDRATGFWGKRMNSSCQGPGGFT